MSISIPTVSMQYADLNIRHTGNPKQTVAMVKRAILMGYDAIAINIDVGDIVAADNPELSTLNISNPEPPAKKKKKGDMKATVEKGIPDPFIVDPCLLDTTILEQQGKRLRIFTRLTITLNDQSMIHNIFMSPQLKKYDIIAVRPEDEAILATLSRKPDAIDVVCFTATASKVSWAQKGKVMEQMRDEGIGFEITYGPALQSRDDRRAVLANGRRIIRALKSKGVIVSSAAESVIDLRAPVDVMNMLKLWDIDGAHARPMISLAPQAVLHRAEARRTVKGALHVVKVEKEEDGEPKSVIPSKSDHKLALKRLLTVKEFRAQVEFVPKGEGTNSKT